MIIVFIVKNKIRNPQIKKDLEETIIEKPTTHPGTNGQNENQIGDQRGVSTLICMDETYRKLLSISQAMFTKKQFKYLIDTMQMYHFTDEKYGII